MKLFVETLSERPGVSPHTRINRYFLKHACQNHPHVAILLVGTSGTLNWYRQFAELGPAHSCQFLEFPKFVENKYLRPFFIEIVLPLLLRKYRVDWALWSTPAPFIKPRNTLYAQRVTNIISFVDPAYYCSLAQRFFNVVKLRSSCRNADLVLANTEYTRSLVHDNCGVDNDTIVVINEAPDEEIKEFIKTGTTTKNTDILIPSGLYRHKNVGTALAGIIKASGQLNRPLVTVICGGRNPAIEIELKTRFEHEFTSGIFRYAGCLEKTDVWESMAKATCVMYPSRYESFGIPPLEAMSVGTPVIVSDIPPHREVCADAALYCHPDSPDDFCTQLVRLLSDDGLFEQLAVKGDINLRRFSWQTNVAETLRCMTTARDEHVTE